MKQFLINRGWPLLAPIWYTLKGLAMIMVPIGAVIGVFAILTMITMKVFGPMPVDEAIFLTSVGIALLAPTVIVIGLAYSIGKGHR